MLKTPIKLTYRLGLVFSTLLFSIGLNTCAIQFSSAIASPTQIKAEQNRYRLAAQYSEAHGGLTMVVVDNSGKVVFESYNGVRPERGIPLASGTKSFSCAIALLGIQDGLLTLDEPVANTITEWKGNPRKSRITIRQLLNLTSGIPGGEIANVPSYREAIDTRLTALPGNRFQYGPIPFQIFGEVMRRKLAARGMPGTPLTYLDSRLLQPMGLKYDRWFSPNGEPNLASGAVMSATEWAKFGVLLLNRGQWQGQQLLNSGQINQCFQGTTANPAYGLTFWLNKQGFTHSGQPMQPIRAASNAMAMARGAGEQLMIVLPEQNLVVVRQGRFNQQMGLNAGGFNLEKFLNLLLTGAN
jgi:CubicO group peptidase (beta-lactamase class C family)